MPSDTARLTRSGRCLPEKKVVNVCPASTSVVVASRADGGRTEDRPAVPWPAADEDIDALVAPGAVQPAFQPIVDLERDQLLGLEALARWPALGVGPDAAFAAARRAGRTAQLDWACRTAALSSALDAGIGRDLTLFLNVEPATLGSPPASALPLLERSHKALRLVVEITERALVQRPASLLATVASIRDRGWGIALDDVGAVPESLAMLPLIRPDVVKLDLSLVQRFPSSAQAKVVAAVMAYAEHAGAVILAEGIENEADLERARSFGATAGQGWHLGRPGPIPPVLPVTSRLVISGPRLAVAATPFDVVGSNRTQTGRKRLLLAMSRHIEDQGLELPIPPVVLSAFQDASRVDAATAHRYARLAERCSLVVALGAGMPDEPAPGVRGIDLDDDDPLVGEWTVIVVGAHYAAALIARDLGDRGPELDRRFEFTVTHDRQLVLTAARSLLRRVGATGR